MELLAPLCSGDAARLFACAPLKVPAPGARLRRLGGLKFENMEREYSDHPIVRRVRLIQTIWTQKFENYGFVWSLSRFVNWWRKNACKTWKSNSGQGPWEGFDHEEREMLETFIFQLKISFLFVCIQIF